MDESTHEIDAGRYPSPVDAFLTLGEAQATPWPDYVATYRLESEHVPALIQMVRDEALICAGSESSKVWAPLYAWRALAQLRAEEAIGPLLEHLANYLDDDWAHEEIPQALAMIGPAIIAPVRDFLADRSHDTFARVAASNALLALAKEDPAQRDPVVRIITDQMARLEGEDVELNGYLLWALLDLEAVEAAPVIERAFAADAIDESIAGDWEDAQYKLGLTTTPPPPGKRYLPRDPVARQNMEMLRPVVAMLDHSHANDEMEGDDEGGAVPAGARKVTDGAQQRKQAKAKRKQARASQKKNRKKKK